MRHHSLKFKIIAFFIFTLLALTNVLAVEFSAPVISVAPDVYYPLDEILYIEGKAAPKSKVELFFEKSGKSQPVRIAVESNSNGEWYFSEKFQLSSGEWMVRARLAGDPPSDWSNPRVIRSVVSGIVFGSVKIKYVPVILIFSVALIIIFILFLYSILKVRTIQQLELERQMREKTVVFRKALHEKDRQSAEVLVEQNFSDLRKKILEELEHLDKYPRDGAVLSKEEQGHRDDLLKELRKAEDLIEKRIKDI